MGFFSRSLNGFFTIYFCTCWSKFVIFLRITSWWNWQFLSPMFNEIHIFSSVINWQNVRFYSAIAWWNSWLISILFWWSLGLHHMTVFQNLTSFLRCFDEIYFAFNWRNSRLISVMFENVRFYHTISSWKSQFCLNRSTEFSINSILVLRNLWFHYILDDIRYFLSDLLM